MSLCISFVCSKTTQAITGVVSFLILSICYLYIVKISLDFLPTYIKDYNAQDVFVVLSLIAFPISSMYIFMKTCSYWTKVMEEEREEEREEREVEREEERDLERGTENQSTDYYHFQA